MVVLYDEEKEIAYWQLIAVMSRRPIRHGNLLSL